MQQRTVRTIQSIAGLLPLRMRRRDTMVYEHGEYRLQADARYGMPDARDLLALALCADAALRGVSDVLPRHPVTAESLLRVAAVNLHRVDGHRNRALLIAKEWTTYGSVLLADGWCAWVSSAGRHAEISWTELSSMSPGAQTLAIILATEQRDAVGLTSLAARCGTAAASKGKAHQQVKRWLAEMRAAGFTRWALDSVERLVFRTALFPIPPGRPSDESDW